MSLIDMSVSKKIEAIKADITRVHVDVIVNAANPSLLGGGGVDGAIHRAGGPSILEDCKKIIAKQGSCKTGDAVITGAGKLPAKFVIHTVGPIWRGGDNNEREKLADCYKNSLKLAVENTCKTMSFPNISTGVYGFPKKNAAKIAVETVHNFLQQNSALQKVIFVCYDDENFALIKEELESPLSPEGGT